MGFVEDCQYIRKDRYDQEINVHILSEPLLFNNYDCCSDATLGINDGSSLYLTFRCIIDCKKENYIYIDDLQGDHSTLPIHHYGTMLLSALFEHMVYIENKYNIKFSYITGQMTRNDKTLYWKRRERQLSDFYADAISYIKQYVPQKDISIEYYQDKSLKSILQGKDKEQANYFKYIVKEEAN